MSAQAPDDELRAIEREIRAGNYAAVEKRAAQAVKAQPASAFAQHLLGASLHGQGQLDRAIACYRKSAQLDAGSAELQRDLGFALLEKGRPKEAIDSFEAALRLEPADDVACTGLATALRDLGVVDAARRTFQRALRLRVRRWLLAPFRIFKGKT